MADAKPSTVLWPDLTRFGMELTVAYNPSLGRNLLRFVVLDRNLAARASGLDADRDDFFRIMRDVGFAYLPSETENRRMVAYWDAVHRGASIDEQDEVTRREMARLYFYSPSLSVRKEMLKKIVPALEDRDFRQIPVADIKHFDYRYLTDKKAEALFRSQQAFADGEPGVFFTTPGDRALMQRLVQKSAPLHQALRLGGGRHDKVEIDLSDPDVAAVAALHVVPSVQQLCSAQALLADGAMLRMVSPSAVVMGYPRYEDAVVANGGDVEGIERVQFPEALPVAFDYPARRVMVIKDGRFLEFSNVRNRGIDDLESMYGAQYHWTFLDRVVALSRESEAAMVAGVFEDAALAGPGLDTAIETLARLRELMRHAVDGLSRYGSKECLTTTDLLMHAGVRHSMQQQVFGPDFSRFVGEFPVLCLRIDQKRAERDAEAVMAAGVQAALSKVQSVEADQIALRREDAGEKIGGARKDYARRWLAVDELSDMTVRERADVVAKDNVWPTPDYAAMEEQGISPEVAYCVRELRNALPTNPYRGGYNIKRHSLQSRAESDLTLKQCESFVKAVSVVRDAVGGVKTKEDLLAAVVRIHAQADMGSYTWKSDHWFADGAGYHFTARVLPSLNLDANGKLKNSWEFDRFVAVAQRKCEGGWAWAGKKQRAKAVEAEMEAEAVAAKRERPEPEVPHLDHIERAGIDYRQGKGVDEQLLMDVFGFRAVEYGNWLPQDERQVVLNHSFDAFMDLAAALKLPPKAMSLGGDLALAFGSRGRGGKNAARAHYEPARNVINLTRLSGAGALAHEWGHGLDYFLAKSCEVSQTRALTERREKNRNAPLPIAAAFVELVEESRRRYRSKDEVITDTVMADTGGGKLSVADLARGRLEDFVSSLERLLPEDKRGTVFREFAMQEIGKLLVPVDGDPRLAQIMDTGAFVQNLATALDLQAGADWRERAHPDALKFPGRVAAWANERCEKVELLHKHYDAKRFPADSRFLKDAEYFDSFRSKPYWSTRVEMFARAFESWVQDRIEREPGQRSQYLVFGREERAEAEYSGYPRGEERSRIATAMAAFFEEHRPELLRRMGLIQPEATLRADLEAA